MVSASGGTMSCRGNYVSSFSISAFCVEVRSRRPSSRLAFLIFFRMSRNWLVARVAAEAGLLSSCAAAAESFPKEGKPVPLLFNPGSLTDSIGHQTYQTRCKLWHLLDKIGE